MSSATRVIGAAKGRSTLTRGATADVGRGAVGLSPNGMGETKKGLSARARAVSGMGAKGAAGGAADAGSGGGVTSDGRAAAGSGGGPAFGVVSGDGA